MGAPKRKLPPALAANIWKPGQSGNPAGHSGLYGEAIKLAQRAAPKAVRRLIELMDSPDERVAAVACNSILDRALGKPTPAAPEEDDYVARIVAMSPEERVRTAQALLEEGRKYLPLLEKARSKGLIPPREEEEDIDGIATPRRRTP